MQSDFGILLTPLLGRVSWGGPSVMRVGMNADCGFVVINNQMMSSAQIRILCCRSLPGTSGPCARSQIQTWELSHNADACVGLVTTLLLQRQAGLDQQVIQHALVTHARMQRLLRAQLHMLANNCFGRDDFFHLKCQAWNVLYWFSSNSPNQSLDNY